MNQFLSPTRSASVAAAAVLLAGHASAGRTLSLNATSFGGDAVTAAAGEPLTVAISLDGGSASFNSALLRLVFTIEGVQIDGYEWSFPFTTGGMTDFSLIGDSLPLVVVDDTLVGPGYPLTTADVEFGNFLLSGTAHQGSVLNVFIRVPEAIPSGTEFFVAAVPDLLMNGFLPLDVSIGHVLSVTVQQFRRADLDHDGIVGSADLAIMLGAIGGPPNPPPEQGSPDLNGDGIVSAFDLGALLGDWG